MTGGYRQIRQKNLADQQRAVFDAEYGTATPDHVRRLDEVDDGADVVVIACGGLGQVCGTQGWHVIEHNGALVPVVNPLATAVKTAEMMVGLQRALGIPVPGQAHAVRLSADDIARIERGFGIHRR